MTSPFDGMFGSAFDPATAFDEAMKRRRASDDAQVSFDVRRTPEQARADRRKCDAEGHRYQVAGRLSPSQVRCSRCRCTWAIGPKTEPAS